MDVASRQRQAGHDEDGSTRTSRHAGQITRGSGDRCPGVGQQLADAEKRAFATTGCTCATPAPGSPRSEPRSPPPRPRCSAPPSKASSHRGANTTTAPARPRNEDHTVTPPSDTPTTPRSSAGRSASSSTPPTRRARGGTPTSLPTRCPKPVGSPRPSDIDIDLEALSPRTRRMRRGKTGHPPGAKRTTSPPTPKTAAPPSTTAPCPASPTTTSCTTATGQLTSPPTTSSTSSHQPASTDNNDHYDTPDTPSSNRAPPDPLSGRHGNYSQTMKRLGLGLVACYLAIAVGGRIAEAKGATQCDCAPDCWCQRPGFGVFRWAFPFWHHGPSDCS